MGKKILIAEDSVSIRHLMSTTLREAGYTVRTAEDGQDALEKIESEPVDMLITDLNMPRLDGLDLIRRVRQMHRFLPILMLTTETQEERKREGKTAGASAWITKPFKPEQLLGVVRMVLP